MRKNSDIRTFEDRRFQTSMARASIAVVAGGVAVGVLWGVGVGTLSASSGVAMEPFESPSPAVWALSLAAAVLASLALHELVHAFFFRRFAPPGARVTFGANLRAGMVYASAEGVVYTRDQYRVIALSPSIVVTALLIAVGIGLKWPLWTIVTATAHLSGCTGDWGYVARIDRDPSIKWCEDTSWGVRFYGEDLEDAPAGFSVVDGGKGAGKGSDDPYEGGDAE